MDNERLVCSVADFESSERAPLQEVSIFRPSGDFLERFGFHAPRQFVDLYRQ
jgi:hypothetical protein